MAPTTNPGDVRRGGTRALHGASAIAIAVGVMNVTSYVYTIVASAQLGPRPFGAFAALMNVLLVVSVLSLGLQATAARRIATHPDQVPVIEAAMRRVGRQGAIYLGLLCLLLAPLINKVLRLDSLPVAALVAVAVVPMTIMGAQAGVLQGERRWLPLSLVYLANGVPRLLLGTALILWSPTETMAMLGAVISAFAPVVVGAIALRHRPDRGAADTGHHTARSVWSETLHNSQALLAFFALSYVDVIVARNVLDSHNAGLYAGGLILVKAVMFLPQFVVVLAFPSMGTEHARRPALVKSLTAVAVVGVLGALATFVLSGLAVLFIGGNAYHDIQHELWAFALVGTVLSMLQLLVYSVLARQARRSVLLLWSALLVVVVGGQFVDTLQQLLTLVLATDTVLFGLLLAVSLWHLRHDRPTAADQFPG